MNRFEGIEWLNDDQAGAREARMNICPALWLAVAFAIAGPAHAQGCSGGGGGGADATGNECSDSATVLLYAARYDAAAPLPLARTGKIVPARAAIVSAAPTSRRSVAANAPKPVAPGLHRLANTATPIANPVQTSTVGSGHSTPCSGGAYGGMDLTGNQCGEYPVPDRSASPVYASRR